MAFLLPLVEGAGAEVGAAGAAGAAESGAAATAAEGGSAGALNTSQFGSKAANVGGAANAADEGAGSPMAQINKYMPGGLKLPDPFKEIGDVAKSFSDPTNSLGSLDLGGIAGHAHALSEQQFGG
jgi:hypothetical protein